MFNIILFIMLGLFAVTSLLLYLTKPNSYPKALIFLIPTSWLFSLVLSMGMGVILFSQWAFA
jgi:hypothetical protein